MHLLENTCHFLHWKIQIFKVKFDKRNHTCLVQFHNSTMPWEHKICTIWGPARYTEPPELLYLMDVSDLLNLPDPYLSNQIPKCLPFGIWTFRMFRTSRTFLTSQFLSHFPFCSNCSERWNKVTLISFNLS